MRLLFAIVSVLCISPALVWAASIRVRSGEHGDFTRLVLHLPSAMKWSFSQNEKEAYVKFPDQKPTFDLAKAFERIQKDRIASLVADSDGLKINFACDCEGAAEFIEDSMLIIDVRPAPNKAEPVSIDLPVSYWPEKVLQTSDLMPVMAELDVSAGKSNIAPNLMAGAEQRLFRQLSRAASLGLVDLASPKAIVDQKKPVSKKEEVLASSLQSLHPQINLDVSSGVSDYAARVLERDVVSQSGVHCIPNSKLDIESWRHGEDFASGLVALRRGLGGEIEAIDQEVALKLVRHYLHFGFGVEALSLLEYLPLSEEKSLLVDISTQIEDIEVKESVFEEYLSCDSSIALWALLASGDAAGTEIHPKTIVHSFSELPYPLQYILGARLAAALAKSGFSEDAGMVLRIMERQSEVDNPEAIYVESQLQTEDHENNQVTKRLKISAEADAEISPEALIRLVESEIHEGRPVLNETVDLVASYVHQYRDTDQEAELQDALVLAYSHSDQLENAWLLLTELESQRPEAQAWKAFFDALQTRGTDFEFLRYGALLSDRSDQLTPVAAQKAAKRFLQMGFPDLAQVYMQAPRNGAAEHDRRMMLAQIAFDQGNLLTAKAELLGVSGEDVDALMAQIRSKEAAPKPETNAVADPLSNVSLAQGHAALQQSQILRDRLAQLLSETEMPPDSAAEGNR